MAEAIAALSLASNILQVIDFGSKFASTAWKIHRGAHQRLDGLDEVASLRLMNTHLGDVLREIRTQSSIAGPASESNEGIVNLAKECATLVEELRQSLNKLGLGDAVRKRDALRAAFKLTWKREEIGVLEARLNVFRSQLTLGLLVSMRYYTSQSLIQQDVILKELHAVHRNAQTPGSAMNNSTDPSDSFGTSVLNYVTSKLNQREQDRERLLLQTDIIHAIDKSLASRLEGGPSPVDISVSEQTRKKSLGVLLASLHYGGMKDREGRISEAHQSTFQWLFKDSDNDKWTSLKDWLESDDKLYWITGKAGSGKSTLMKYICYPVQYKEGIEPEPRCLEHLTTWSGEKRLIIASFYFWNSGIEMQMTQRGLLMSLLYKILQQCPELAPLACPNRWEALCLFGGAPQGWEEQELRDALHRATDNVSQLDAGLALFVDGLDEFDGKPEALISLFHDIIKFPNVKLCVASRPWVEFEDAFKHKPSLKLEDLTYDDIKSFVTTRFHDEPMFFQLRQQEEEFADQLIEDIVSKASGVFLWVTLVVSSLLAGMTFGDRVSDLKRRLDLLPPDLSKLYEKMLLSLDPFYLEHAAQLFSLVGASSEPMNLLLASFADEDEPDFALRSEIRPLQTDEIMFRMDAMRRRINSRSKGLLEVKGPLPTTEEVQEVCRTHVLCTVQYLHRTVKDYIESDSVQKTLQSAMRSTFDAYLSLLAGNLAYIKGVQFSKANAPQDLFSWHIGECLKSARDVLPSNIPKMVLLLDELDKTGSIVFQSRTSTSDTNLWTSIFFEEMKQVPNHWRYELVDFNPGLLNVAARFGIVEYVRIKAAQGCLTHKSPFSSSPDNTRKDDKWPLLMDVTAWKLYDSPRISLKMIQCLLDKGADPSYTVLFPSGARKTSPLIVSVSRLMSSARRRAQGDIKYWVEVNRLFTRAVKIDSDTIDISMGTFLHDERFIVPIFGIATLPNFIKWKSARKSLRKALQGLAHGGNADFSVLVDNITDLTIPFIPGILSRLKIE